MVSASIAHSENAMLEFPEALNGKSQQKVAAELIEIMETRGVHKHSGGEYYYSGYGASLFTWETFFDNIVLLHAGDTSLGRNALRIYLSAQRPDGFIPRHWQSEVPSGEEGVWHLYESEEHAQPFLFQVALFLTRASGGDTSWITGDMYQALKKYLLHWTTVWDRDSNGLSEWASACHSGEDNQFDRAGVWRSYYCEGADLNSFLYLDFLAAEKIAIAKGIHDDAADFSQAARQKKELIQKLLWNEKDGFYYDRDIRTGKPIRVKSVAGLFPLSAGIPDTAQAKRIVNEHIMNPKEFWNSHPLPSYAIDERNFTQHHIPPPLIDIYYALNEGHSNWLGGVWGHANYFVTHGLQRYGFDREARLLAAKSYEVSAPDKVIYEWYNSETGEGLGGRGVYAGAEILLRFLPTELETGFQPMLIEDCDKPISSDGLRKALGLQGAFRIGA
jgi:glycogen debranching enzyme